MNEYITVKEAAQILGVSEATVRNLLLKQKLFKARRIIERIKKLTEDLPLESENKRN